VDSAAWTAHLGDGAVCSVHSSWIARGGAGWRLVAHGSEGVLLAEAAGHAGHHPVRLSGTRHDAPLSELVAPADGATAPFEALVRALAEDLRTPAVPGHVPTFRDGAAALRVADAVEATIDGRQYAHD
jgi:predicted dehydrogenase